MKKLFPLLILSAIISQCTPPKLKTISFYKVPLVCGADKEIGCGSRIKPLFIETEKVKEVKESWVNRQGTVIAIVWQDAFVLQKRADAEKEKIIQPLFKKCEIEAELISDETTEKEISENFFANLAPSQKKINGLKEWMLTN